MTIVTRCDKTPDPAVLSAAGPGAPVSPLVTGWFRTNSKRLPTPSVAVQQLHSVALCA